MHVGTNSPNDTLLKTDLFAENCLDRCAELYPNRVALIWERDEPNQQKEVTYRYKKYECTLYIKNLGTLDPSFHLSFWQEAWKTYISCACSDTSRWLEIGYTSTHA